MRIKKTFQGSLPENTVVNTQSDSQTNAYSCEYVNEHLDGVVLYNVAPEYATEDTITLSDSSANYRYIEVLYHDFDMNCNSMKVYQPNGKILNLISVWSEFSGQVSTKVNYKTISGNQIINGGGAEINNGVVSTGQAWHYQYIYRVIGYK